MGDGRCRWPRWGWTLPPPSSLVSLQLLECSQITAVMLITVAKLLCWCWERRSNYCTAASARRLIHVLDISGIWSIHWTFWGIDLGTLRRCATEGAGVCNGSGLVLQNGGHIAVLMLRNDCLYICMCIYIYIYICIYMYIYIHIYLHIYIYSTALKWCTTEGGGVCNGAGLVLHLHRGRRPRRHLFIDMKTHINIHIYKYI